MAYTRVWNRNSPVGTDAANTLATIIDNFKQDVEERASTYFGGWNTASPTDPITALPAILGNVTGKTMYLGPQCFAPEGNSNQLLVLSPSNSVWAGSSGVSVPGILLCGFHLPVGAILQNVKVLGYIDTTLTLSLALYKTPFTASNPAQTQIGSTANFVANGTWQIVSVGGNPLGHTILASTFYTIQLAHSAGSAGKFIQVFGAEITYDVADSTQLI